MPPSEESVRGTLYGATAFTIWGVVPAYYKLIEHVDSYELVSHRAVWIVVFNLIALAILGRLGTLRTIWTDRRTLGRLTASSAFIAMNWLVFLWAATHDRFLEISLGYFIAPLVHVTLGLVVLRERLRPLQAIAVGIASVGVAYIVIQYGAVPWVALVLPFTFGIYGLIRKHTIVNPIAGLTTEMALLLPLAAGTILYLGYTGHGHMGPSSLRDSTLLILNGPITIVPLTLFAAATTRIQLTTIGFLQYIGPTLTFLMAIFVFPEPFDRAKLIAFVFVWISLAIYTIDGVRFSRVGAGAKLEPVPE